jgi:hypothetical protein
VHLSIVCAQYPTQRRYTRKAQSNSSHFNSSLRLHFVTREGARSWGRKVKFQGLAIPMLSCPQSNEGEYRFVIVYEILSKLSAQCRKDGTTCRKRTSLHEWHGSARPSLECSPAEKCLSRRLSRTEPCPHWNPGANARLQSSTTFLDFEEALTLQVITIGPFHKCGSEN